MKIAFEKLRTLDRFVYNGTKFQKLNDHQGKCQSYDQAQPEGRKRESEKTEPIYIKKLATALNSYTEAGKLIGMTGGAIKAILDKH